MHSGDKDKIEDSLQHFVLDIYPFLLGTSILRMSIDLLDSTHCLFPSHLHFIVERSYRINNDDNINGKFFKSG